jgi:HD-like signal output (HDOD) protein/DNA-binding response OmpR family regulator
MENGTAPKKQDTAGHEDLPLILLFSPRPKIRSVLAAGLLHSNYRIMESDTPYVASVKANQYVPDVVLVDITKDNIRDFLFLTRLERSIRTQDIAILVSVTVEVRQALDKIYEEAGAAHGKGEQSRVQLIEYPFHFSQLKERIDAIIVLKRSKTDGLKKSAPENHADMIGQRLFDPQISVQAKFNEIHSTIRRQWAFPFTVIRAFDIIGDEKSCGNELAKCIEADLAATTAIIGLANKLYYAKRSGRITQVFEAILRIGFNETRNILASLLFIDITSDSNRKYGFRRIDFWMHSLATAVIAEKLCADCGYNRPELGFLAGLIHDIGKIPIDVNFETVFPRLLEETTNHIAAFNEVEERMMGFTHADFGHHLMNLWNFPSYVALTVLNHHNPERILDTRIPMDRIVQEAVFTANIFAKALMIGHSCDEVLREIPAPMLKEMHIRKGPLAAFIDQVFIKFKRYFDYLRLSADEATVGMPELNSREHEILVVQGEKVDFHPCSLALKANGYRLSALKSLPEVVAQSVMAIIFLPDKGGPLDITVTEDDGGEEAQSSFLRIFLLDGLSLTETKREFNESNIIIMDRNRLDIRLLLHVIEDYCYAAALRRIKKQAPRISIADAI